MKIKPIFILGLILLNLFQTTLQGGESDFKSLVDKAKSLNMKIIVSMNAHFLKNIMIVLKCV